MARFTKKHYLAAGVAAAVVAAGVGTAYAYWTDSGSGSGSATTGTSSHFAVSVGTPTGDPLSPGGPTDHVTFTVTNNGSGNQKVSSATALVAKSDGSTWDSVSGCSAADYSITNLSLTPTDLASGGSVTGSFDIQMVDNLSASQDACKNATVPLYVSVS
jgi:hypothetical protein